jgi:hypothetical protein
MKEFKILKKIAVTLFWGYGVFALYGCPQITFEATIQNVRGGGIVNDSMALLKIDVEDRYYQDRFINDHSEYIFRGCFLSLVDIRTEKTYWQKEISAKNCTNLRLYMTDSLLFFHGSISVSEPDYSAYRIAFQKFGEEFQRAKQIELKFKELERKKYSIEEDTKSVGIWQNGQILINSSEKSIPDRPWSDGNGYYWKNISGNYYELLDTLTKARELWEPSGEFEWLNECANVKWSSTGVLCLKEISDASGFVLLRNAIDTLAVRHVPAVKPLIFSGNSIISGGWIYLMNKQGQVSEKPLDIKVGTIGNIYTNFYDLYGNIVASYDKEYP